MKSYIIFLFCITVACNKPARKLPYYNSPEFTPVWEKPADTSFHKIRAFAVTDQQGKLFTEKDMSRRICVVDFFFTACPGICPKLTASMDSLQKEFATDKNILLLSYSVTPDRDSVPVLQKYAAEHNVQYKHWRLLTGSRAEIYDLGRHYYFVEEDEGIKRPDSVFLHTENFVLIDKDRYIRGIYNGLDKNSMQALINDVKVLEEE